MGLVKRLKGAPTGVRDILNDAIQNGITVAMMNAKNNFGRKNAAARQTIGEDIGHRI